jgi:hypothetical protein
MLNLADHFLVDPEAPIPYLSVTFNELTTFCADFAISTPRGKTNLTKALEAMGAKRGSIQWKGKPKEDGFIGVHLRDIKYWSHRDSWGKGCELSIH